MKRMITSVLVIMLAFKVYGQILVESPYQQAKEDSVQDKKVFYSFSTGATMISGSGIGHGSSFFFTPEISYRVSSKLMVNAGLMVNQNNYSLPVAYIGDNQSVVIKPTPVANQNIFFASGNYVLSPKFLLTGSMMTTLSPGGTSSSSSETAWQNSFQIMSMGLSYKATENITLSAEMRMVRSNGLNTLPGTNNSLNSFGTGINPLGY